jgi:cell division protein FtsB
MRKEYWIAVSVAALILGFLTGYLIWGASAARVPDMERQLNATQAQLAEAKKTSEKMESNLGRMANEKLNLEKENVALKEAIEKASRR